MDISFFIETIKATRVVQYNIKLVYELCVDITRSKQGNNFHQFLFLSIQIYFTDMTNFRAVRQVLVELLHSKD